VSDWTRGRAPLGGSAGGPTEGVATRGRVECVGREREREYLAAALRAAVGGHGQVVLLAGEPGIGKTRLAEEAAGVAAGLGVPCRWGRATDEEGSPPYWLFRQVLRGLAVDRPGGAAPELALVVPELAGGARPGGPVGAEQRFRAFEAVTAALVGAAEPGGLLVVLDDLHWADPSSLRLLVHLARAVAGSRLLVVATYRDTETGGREALRRVLGELAGSGTCSLGSFQRWSVASTTPPAPR
jgi:hypothetical protein